MRGEEIGRRTPLTVTGISQRPMTSSWGCDRPARVVRGSPSPALLQRPGHRSVVAVQAHEAPVQVEVAEGAVDHSPQENLIGQGADRSL